MRMQAEPDLFKKLRFEVAVGSTMSSWSVHLCGNFPFIQLSLRSISDFHSLPSTAAVLSTSLTTKPLPLRAGQQEVSPNWGIGRHLPSPIQVEWA